MGWWTEQVVPRATHVALGTRGVRSLRRKAVAGAIGEVVELGYGSGLTLAVYPPAVTAVLAVEPSPVARTMARGVEVAATIPVRHVGLDGAHLDLPDASADTVVSTFTLCTIPDLPRALAEVRRVLRPGGRFLFLEHGLDPDPRVARRQRRASPLQQRVVGGCHLDRDPAVAVRDAGLTLASLVHRRMAGPGALSYLSLGAAGHPAP